MKIAVLYNLPTKRALASPFLATEEDTRESAVKVRRALSDKGAQAFLVPVTEDGLDDILHIGADCVFNLIEWSGLDLPLAITAFGNLKTLGIAYTGADSANFQVTSDKVKMKEALDLAGLPTPRWQLFTTGREPVRKDMEFPVIMKLAWEHCSIGLTRDAVVREARDLPGHVAEHIRVFGQPVYVEEFVGGREFQVTLLSMQKGIAVLPAAEIVFPNRQAYNFLTFEGRWVEKHPDYDASSIVLARLPPKLSRTIETICSRAFTTLGFCDYARYDMRMRGSDIYFLEVNSNPGLDDSDDYSMTVSYKAAGMTLSDVVWEIVSSCFRRFRKAPWE